VLQTQENFKTKSKFFEKLFLSVGLQVVCYSYQLVCKFFVFLISWFASSLFFSSVGLQVLCYSYQLVYKFFVIHISWFASFLLFLSFGLQVLCFFHQLVCYHFIVFTHVYLLACTFSV